MHACMHALKPRSYMTEDKLIALNSLSCLPLVNADKMFDVLTCRTVCSCTIALHQGYVGCISQQRPGAIACCGVYRPTTELLLAVATALMSGRPTSRNLQGHQQNHKN